MYFRFGGRDDVKLSYNEGNRPESNTTRMLRPVRQVAATGAKSAVSNSILFPSVAAAAAARYGTC